MRSLRIAIVACLLVMTLAVPALAKTELVVWYHSGKAEERAVLEYQVKTFNAMQDQVAIKAVEIPEGGYNEQVQAAALAGGLPDILDLDGPFIANYAWSGYLRPLDKYITPQLKKDLLPSIIAQGEYKGKIYALGTFDSGLAMWANKRYLKDVGARIPGSVEDAWTFTEFMEILRKLKAHPKVKYPLDFKINYGRGEWFSYGFLPIFQGFGADMIDRKTMLSADGVLNGPEALAAAAWFQSLFAQGYADPNPPGDTEFIDGRAALSWVGHWVWQPYKQALGEDLILIPMPKFFRQATGMGSWAWAITSNCKYPDAAWQFLEFILRPEEIVRMTDANGAVPSRVSAARLSKVYQPGAPLNILVQQLQRIAIPRPVTPAYPALTSYFAEAMDNIISGADVRKELDQAVKRIDEEIKYMGLK
ncbi:MAG: sugar ABC transporter substrate-binding protein [Bacillota bacterium]|nr:sugar ABC transporter substrate-binding protein [Bacillota bacterium]